MSHLSYEEVGITEPEEGIIEFTIKPEHLKLLRALQLQWIEGTWGGLQTNLERPYGSTDVRDDIQNQIDIEILLSDEGAKKLHKEAAMALQIALKTGKFRPKTFRAPKYSQLWHEHTPKKEKKAKDEEDEGQLPLDVAGDGDEEP
jgi:hypothetical protein